MVLSLLWVTPNHNSHMLTIENRKDLYTAGTVILAVLVTPTLRRAEKDNFASLEMSWAECIECLSRFADTEGGFAKRCLWMLQSASSQILSDAQANRHGLIVPDHHLAL